MAASRAGTRAYLVLAVLLIVYVLNQWDRYLLVYLSSTSIPACPTKHTTDVCHVPDGVRRVPLCHSCPGNSSSSHWPQCSSCHACLSQHDAKKYNLLEGACITPEEYGILGGFAFSLLYVTCGLVAGRLADTANRALLIALALLVWSAATAAQGAASNFVEMLFSRVVLGIGEAFSAPASYSLIADYFPPQQRATANGIYAFGVYVGGGLSSLSLAIASAVGWRPTSVVIGAGGAVFALLLPLLIQDPRRRVLPCFGGRKGGQDDETAEARLVDGDGDGDRRGDSGGDSDSDSEDGGSGGKDGGGGKEERKYTVLQAVVVSLTTPEVAALFVASALRFLGGYSIGVYLPQLFKRQFPQYGTEYAVLNAFVISIGGALSSYAGGFITDRWARTTPRARAWVPALGALLGLPCFAVTAFSSNFYVAIGALLAEYIFAECWFGPAISIIQTLPANVRGVAISLYLFVGTLVGNAGPALLGVLDPGTTALRVPLFIIVAVSYGGCALAFLITGALMKPRPASSLASAQPSAPRRSSSAVKPVSYDALDGRQSSSDRV